MAANNNFFSSLSSISSFGDITVSYSSGQQSSTLKIGSHTFDLNNPPHDLETYNSEIQDMYWRMATKSAKKDEQYIRYSDKFIKDNPDFPYDRYCSLSKDKQVMLRNNAKKFSESYKKYKIEHGIDLFDLMKKEDLKFRNIIEFRESVLILAEGLSRIGYDKYYVLNQILGLDNFYFNKFTQYDSNAKKALKFFSILLKYGYHDPFAASQKMSRQLLEYFIQYDNNINYFDEIAGKIRDYCPGSDILTKLDIFDIKLIKLVSKNYSDLKKFLEITDLLNAKGLTDTLSRVFALGAEIVKKPMEGYGSDFEKYKNRLLKLPYCGELLNLTAGENLIKILTDDMFVEKLSILISLANANKVKLTDSLLEIKENYLNIIFNKPDNFMLMLRYLKNNQLTFNEFVSNVGPSGFEIALKGWSKVQARLYKGDSLSNLIDSVKSSFNYEKLDLDEFWHIKREEILTKPAARVRLS